MKQFQLVLDSRRAARDIYFLDCNVPRSAMRSLVLAIYQRDRRLRSVVSPLSEWKRRASHCVLRFAIPVILVVVVMQVFSFVNSGERA